MTEHETYRQELDVRGIRPTAVRIMILRTMHMFDTAFSMSDIEQALDTVDKSTVFRTLTLFAERHLIHDIDDGSGAVKYSLCKGDSSPHDHMHVHFTCERCHKTICIRNVQAPMVNLPAGFALHDVNYVLKGLCPDCNKGQTAY